MGNTSTGWKSGKSSPLLRQIRPNPVDQQFVTFGVEMKLIRQKQFLPGSRIRTERNRPGIDKPDIRRGSCVGLDHRVDRLFLACLLPARNARAKRNENNARLRQFAADLLDESFEIFKNLVG